MKDYIYNVLIGGNSIGLTFNRSEAESWIHQSMFQGKKEIIRVAYRLN